MEKVENESLCRWCGKRKSKKTNMFCTDKLCRIKYYHMKAKFETLPESTLNQISKLLNKIKKNKHITL